MNDSKISGRYAKAFFSLSVEENVLEEVKTDIDLIYSIWNTVAELRQFLESPIIKPSEKVAVVREIYKGKIQDSTHSFLDLILKNKRESYLPGIVRAFLSMYKAKKQITWATLTTTYKVDDTLKSSIVELIKSTYSKNVELAENINSDIIGGFILRIDDQQYDASVSTKLKNIKQNLLNTTLKG